MNNLLLTFNDTFEENWSNYIHHVKQEKNEMESLAVNIDNLDKINIKSENSSDYYSIEYKYVDDTRVNRLDRNVLNDVAKDKVNDYNLQEDKSTCGFMLESELNKIDYGNIKEEKGTCHIFSVKSKLNEVEENIQEENTEGNIKIKVEDSLEDTLNEMIDSLEQIAKQQCEMEKNYEKDKIDLDCRESNIIIAIEEKPKSSGKNQDNMQIKTERPHHLVRVNQNKSTNTSKTFKCDICEKKFSNSSQLAMHKLNHIGDFTCNLCQKSFSNSSKLVVHKRRHTGEMPFKCSLCDKGFILKNHLTTHKISHTGETPFKCSMCEKEFSCKKGQSVEIPVKCNLCDKGFSKSDHLSKPKRWRLFSKKD